MRKTLQRYIGSRGFAALMLTCFWMSVFGGAAAHAVSWGPGASWTSGCPASDSSFINQPHFQFLGALPEDAAITNLNAVVPAVAGQGVRLALYSDSGNGFPSGVLVEGTTTVTATKVSIALGSPYYLGKGTDLWMYINTSANGLCVNASPAVRSFQHYGSYLATNAAPSPATAGGAILQLVNSPSNTAYAWVDYTPGHYRNTGSAPAQYSKTIPEKMLFRSQGGTVTGANATAADTNLLLFNSTNRVWARRNNGIIASCGFTGTPAGGDTPRATSFTWSCPGATLSSSLCSFDGSAYAACSGTGTQVVPAAALSVGNHTFSARNTLFSNALSTIGVTWDASDINFTWGIGSWVWMSGNNAGAASGAVWGTRGVAGTGTLFGRTGASTAIDSAGNLYVFGGYTKVGGTDYNYADVWKYTPGSAGWAWAAGVNQAGTTNPTGQGSCDVGPGTTSTSWHPGMRNGQVSWMDSAGDLWVFGGTAYTCSSGSGVINDLWKVNISTNAWTWVSGDAMNAGANGTYGTRGVASPSNFPGAREYASYYYDGTALWMFGGYGVDKTPSNQGNLADLWRYDTGSNLWTWVGGSNSAGVAGTYGSLGVSTAANLPPPRLRATMWKDSSGKVWVFGGVNNTSFPTTTPVYNDLWRFDLTSQQWTWMAGSNNTGQLGTYGIKGIASAKNTPGARYDMASMYDSTSNTAYLFGGYSYGTAGGAAAINDLWSWDGTEWTWVWGANMPSTKGVYGSQGVYGASFTPGARYSPLGWRDPSGNLWIWGGNGFDTTSSINFMNDLWKVK